MFDIVKVRPTTGVLLFGPPGTGKTTIVKAIAYESKAKLFIINGPEIMGGGEGQAEKKLWEIFEEAKSSLPSILFIDEIDSIAPNRENSHGETAKKVVTQLLTLMDGLGGRSTQFIIIAATNLPNSIDPALWWFGWFDKEIEIGVPDEKGRL